MRRKGLITGGTVDIGLTRNDMSDPRACEYMIDKGALCAGDLRKSDGPAPEANE